MSQQPSRSRLPGLTGARFAAAASVFAFHVSLEGFLADPGIAAVYARAVAMAGWTGVGFFFVLSGFVLTWSARADDGPRAFWCRWLAKTYPNHVVTWVVALIALTAVGAVSDFWHAVGNLFLLHAWLPVHDLIASMNDVSWSLSCELFFYLCFPLLLRWIRKIRPERLWHWAGGVVAAVVAVPFPTPLLPTTEVLPWAPVPVGEFWFVYLAPPVRLLDFVLGMPAARIVLSGRWIDLPVPFAVALTGIGYLTALNLPFTHGLVSATVVPLALLIPAPAAVAERLVIQRGALARRPDRLPGADAAGPAGRGGGGVDGPGGAVGVVRAGAVGQAPSGRHARAPGAGRRHRHVPRAGLGRADRAGDDLGVPRRGGHPGPDRARAAPRGQPAAAGARRAPGRQRPGELLGGLAHVHRCAGRAPGAAAAARPRRPVRGAAAGLRAGCGRDHAGPLVNARGAADRPPHGAVRGTQYT
ncbi:putative secreted protein [Saccharothrix espanaensis DSM 44229]|uniref:Putative secreted protein n=1 Tax=Saccharothrix espanaensis (strain ATCC 51144 / DSM 44229 / JCM 9112 / NBRC 15066 / NRRL 15764) TaxID=1179773 RepID=K0JYC4_SACES|nr:acyltransferase [Saccharothrix espanaensis]CCH29709.1 putative secreted protein [Saccharothrix espanaensis DSM 44229]